MSTDTFLSGSLKIDDDGTYLHWAAWEGNEIVTFHILTDTLRELFDEPDAGAIDLFLGNRTEIEQAAHERYAAMGAPAGVVELEHIDFV